MKKVPGSTRAATSKDVANLAGVSQTTVSYVLNGKGNISAETVRRVEAAIAQLRYQPNLGARALKKQKTGVLGLLVRLDATTVAADTLPYIDAIVTAARRNDYDVVLSTQSQEVEDLRRLASRSICDGLILMDVSRDDPRVKLASELSIPVILMGRIDGAAAVDSVDVNTFNAGKLTVKAARDCHRRVVAVGEGGQRLEGFRFISDFYEGMAVAARSYGMEYAAVQLPDFCAEKVRKALHAEIEQAKLKRTAFVVRAPEIVGDLLAALAEANLTVGEDVSVIGYCPDLVAEQFRPALSNVAPALQDLATVLVDQLLRRISKPDLPVSTTLVEPRDIVTRLSLIRCL